MGLRWSGNQLPKNSGGDTGRMLRELRDNLPEDCIQELLHADTIGSRVVPPPEDVVFYVHDPEEQPEYPERS